MPWTCRDITGETDERVSYLLAERNSSIEDAAKQALVNLLIFS